MSRKIWKAMLEGSLQTKRQFCQTFPARPEVFPFMIFLLFPASQLFKCKALSQLRHLLVNAEPKHSSYRDECLRHSDCLRCTRTKGDKGAFNAAGHTSVIPPCPCLASQIFTDLYRSLYHALPSFHLSFHRSFHRSSKFP